MLAPADPQLVEDPLRRLWLPVTVRVAWHLLTAGVRVRPSVLGDAREHVLRSLPQDVEVEHAEHLATAYTADFLARVKKRRYAHLRADPDLGMRIPEAWRDALRSVLDSVGDTVLRLHYGDGLPLERIQKQAAIHLVDLEAAREGVREAMRAIVLPTIPGIDDWQSARLDRLTSRVANRAGGACPGPAGLLSDAGREHADHCPRCSRAVRLIRNGVISPDDLFPPRGKSLIPDGRVRLMALLLHPDGRKHRKRLTRLLAQVDASPAGPDAWLLPADEAEAILPQLRLLALEGTPARHHLRGAVVEVPGRWCRNTLLGPAPLNALDTAAARPWSEIDELGELPPPLPPPPKATRWWLFAGSVGLAAGLAGLWTFQPDSIEPDCPIEVRFYDTGTDWEVRFDVDDLSVVDVVVLDQGELWLQESGLQAEKGRWATGEGDFRFNVRGDGVALITTTSGLEDLPTILAAAAHDPDPLQSVAERVRHADPGSDIAISPRRADPEAGTL